MWGIRGFWDGNYRRFRSQHWCWDPDVWVGEGVRDKWVHIAHIYTGTNVQVYVNGTQRRDWFKDDIDTGNRFALQFGRWTDETRNDRTFKGLMDDFRVYDDVLSASDILQVYGNGNGDLQVIPTIDIPSVVDGSPVQGRLYFLRNGSPVEVQNFDLSNDLSITDGLIDASSLVDEGNGSYRFNFSLNQENQVSQITLAAGNVNDRYGEGNQVATLNTRLMYRAVTRGQDLIAWWPFDNEVIGATSVTGKTANAELANLYDGASVSGFGKFDKGLKFDRTNSRSRMTIQNNGIDLGNNWTLTVWAKNLLPPAANLRSTLYRGQGLQSGRDYDRYLVIRGSDRTLCFLMVMMAMAITVTVQPVMNGPTYFQVGIISVLASGSRTNFYIDGKFVGDADRREQSDIMYVGNSSDNELFAEFLDDVRIYGVSLSFSEVASIYGEGFGDQFPSFLIDYNSSRDSDPRSAKLLVGKDGNLLDMTGLASSDWNFRAVL